MASTVDAARVGEIQDSHEDLEEKVMELTALMRKSKYTVFFTGAGVSTAAGIADYRGPTGCWTRRRVHDLEAKAGNATAEEQQELQQLRAEAEREVAKSDPSAAKVPKEYVEPGFTHMAIATMMHQGFASYVVTTNLDGLFRKAGLTPHQELCCLHGDVFVERCTGCGADFERNYRVRRADSHVHDHRATGSSTCSRCGSATPAKWIGKPVSWTSVTHTVAKRPSEEAITVARVTENARKKWPGAILTSVSGTSTESMDDQALRSAISEASLPLEFVFSVPVSDGNIATGGSTSFKDNCLVGSEDENAGTKDTHINFGEGLDDIDWNEAGEHCEKADLCIVLGTSMSLCHVVHFPFMAKRTVIVNLQPTKYDDKCFRGLRLWATCDDVLQRLLMHLGIDHVEGVPPWRPRDAVPLEELEKAGVPGRQYALAKHLDETARRRETLLAAAQAPAHVPAEANALPAEARPADEALPTADG